MYVDSRDELVEMERGTRCAPKKIKDMVGDSTVIFGVNGLLRPRI